MSLDAWRHSLTPAFEEEDRWGENRLLRRIYLTHLAPPPELVSSVRAVVLRAAKVAMMEHRGGSGHVTPGGRLEPGETQAEALRREVLEECGWRFRHPRQFAVLHFHHLTPKPAGHEYPYPDFLQPIFAVEAETFQRRAIKRAGEIESGSRMTPTKRALEVLEPGQRLLLEAALAARTA